MRLSGIISEVDRLPLQLRVILNGYPQQSAESVIQRVKNRRIMPLPYLFIESVIATKTLNEQGESRLGALFQTGMAKLKAAITPGNSHDLDSLLQFMAPQGGGAKAVTDLVQSAGREQGDLLSNNQWWDQLFGTFGVQDEQIKNNIKDQVQQSISSPAAPQAQQPQQPQQPSQPQQPQSPLGDQFRQAVDSEQRPNSMLDTLRQERQTEQDYQTDLAKQLTDIRQQRSKTRETIGHLKNRLEQALQRKGEEQTAAESVSIDIALALLNENAVAQNITMITNHMLRQISMRCRCGVPIVTEAGLLDRLRGAVRGGRNFLANPELAKRQLGAARSSADNTRVAKVAVQLLTDHLRTTFGMKLQEAGMSPEQVMRKFQVWNQLRELDAKSGGNPSPQLVQALSTATNELQEVFDLFKQTGASGEFHAPIPAEQPTDIETFEEPNDLTAAPAQESPQPEQPPQPEPPPNTSTLNRGQQAVALAASIALGTKIDAAKYHQIGPSTLVSLMVKDAAWAKLMAFSHMRQMVAAELAQYNVEPETIPPEARDIVLRRIFTKIHNGGSAGNVGPAGHIGQVQ